MSGAPPVAVVLAAGFGRRLRPLTDLRPKPLCPVGHRPLVDWTLDRVRGPGACTDAAVNVHYGRAAMEAHLARLERPVHVSVEREAPLGTAGAIGRLRDWIDGRPVVVANSDAWGPTAASVEALLRGWDGERVRLLVVPASGADVDFPEAGGRFAGVSVMPWSAASTLRAEPSGLYEALWRHVELDYCFTNEPFFDCGTPASYLAANLAWSGGESVVGAGAVVEGEVVRSVVWPGGVVRPGERLVECIRAGADVTVDGAVGRSGP